MKPSHSAVTHLNALTSLRFFAALLVVFFHDGQHLFANSPGWIQNIVGSGFIGVPFFFILSGFILAYNYLPRKGAFSLSQFWTARFARVYPVYAFSLIISAPFFWNHLVATHPGPETTGALAGQALLSFGLVQAWIPHAAFAWNGPAWSLSVEAFFYLMFPFLIAGPLLRRPWLPFLALLVLGGLLFGLDRVQPAWGLLGQLKGALGWANPLLWLPLFLIGIQAGRHALNRTTSPQESPSISKPILLALSLGLGLVLAGGMASNLQEKSMLLFCYALALPCAGLIRVLAITGNPVSRWLSHRWLVRLGESSYALYILHRPIHEGLTALQNQLPWLDLNSTTGFWIYCALAIFMALGTWHVLETPCRRWIRRTFSKSPAQSKRQPVRKPSDSPASNPPICPYERSQVTNRVYSGNHRLHRGV